MPHIAYLRQYVGSISILAIVTALKDSHYFPRQDSHDLWAATLCTDEASRPTSLQKFARKRQWAKEARGQALESRVLPPI